MIDFQKYFGIKYQPKGRDWDGCDCWGFILLIIEEEFGVKLPYCDFKRKAGQGVVDSYTDCIADLWQETDKPKANAIGILIKNRDELHSVLFLDEYKHIELTIHGVRVGNNSCRKFYKIYDFELGKKCTE